MRRKAQGISPSSPEIPESEQNDADERLVKVFISLESADWHDYRTESVWAEPIGGDLYLIRNVPLYAMGLSYLDTICASLVDGSLTHEGVKRRGGHSTYRFFTLDGIADEQWTPYWQPLEEIGCTYERGTSRLFAVDVPPEVDIFKAYRFLDAGEKAGVWSFQEACCGRPLQE